MADRAATVRPFTDADEDAVVALWERCGLARPWNDPHRDIARKRTVQPELFLVAEATGEVVGSAMFGYDGHRGWVNYLAVDPAHCGRGIARTLMADGERLLRERGCPKLNLQVRSGNTEVIAFYEALGYGRDDVLSYGRRPDRGLSPPHHSPKTRRALASTAAATTPLTSAMARTVSGMSRTDPPPTLEAEAGYARHSALQDDVRLS